jgi:uracil-DNA glycosylase family 4
MTTLKQKIEACSKCPLRAKLTEFEKPNFGVGSNKPKVMIVIDNNTSDSSFLIDGLKLEYLEKNLTKYGIDKSDLYITPLVKCARKPTVKSFKECEGWIKEEIKEFKPLALIFISAFNFLTNNPAFVIECLKYLPHNKNLDILHNLKVFNTSLSKLANSSSEDKKYTDEIFTKIKEHCA